MTLKNGNLFNTKKLLQQSYPSMDYDKVIKIHDDKVEKWEYDNGCHISQILKKMQ